MKKSVWVIGGRGWAARGIHAFVFGPCQEGIPLTFDRKAIAWKAAYDFTDPAAEVAWRLTYKPGYLVAIREVGMP